MGVDFIRSCSGKPHNKRWAQSIDRLKEPSLFDVHFEGECQFITLSREGQITTSAGGDLILQLEGNGSCTAFDGLNAVGRLEQPPENVVTFLNANNGIAPVVLDHIGVLGNTIEVRLP